MSGTGAFGPAVGSVLNWAGESLGALDGCGEVEVMPEGSVGGITAGLEAPSGTTGLGENGSAAGDEPSASVKPALASNVHNRVLIAPPAVA
jgi:hypothetical protein